MQTRRQLLKDLSLMAIGLSSAKAFAFSTDKPVRVIVPNAAGGGMDILARTICQTVSEAVKQTLIVENKPGAATAIGAAEASRAPADGNTLLIADNGTLTINPLIYEKLNYSPEEDFTPISLLAKFPMIFVCGPLVKESSVQEILASRPKDKPFTYGSPGLGSPHHLAMELFAKISGLTVQHVPYKGAAPAIQEVASGQIDGMMVDYAAARAMLSAQKVRPIAVANDSRLRQLPDVPTFGENGFEDMIAAAYVGVVAPSQTSQSAIDFWEREFMRALASNEVRAKLIEFGVEPVGSAKNEYANALQRDKTTWSSVVSNLKLPKI